MKADKRVVTVVAAVPTNIGFTEDKRKEAGKQFDPSLVAVIVDLVEGNKIELQGQQSDMPYPPLVPSAGVEESGQTLDDRPTEAFFEKRDQDPEMQD